MIKTFKLFSIFAICAVLLLTNACTGSKTVQQDTKKTSGPSVVRGKSGVDTALIERNYIDACKHIALSEYNKAVVLLQNIVKADPNNDASFYQLGKIFFEYGQASDGMEYIKTAININPANIEYQSLYADMLGYSASYIKAAEVYTNIIKTGKATDEMYYRLAYSYEKAGKINDAIATMQLLKSKTGDDEGVIFELQRLYALDEQYNEAIKWLKKLMEIDPENTMYLRYLSEYYEKNNQPELAAATFDILLSTDTNNTDLQFRKASLFQKAGNTTAYYEAMRKAFFNSAGNIDTKIFYLILFVDSLDKKTFTLKDTVIEWTNLLVNAHPEDAKAYAMQGDFLYYSGSLSEAAVSYNKSLNLRSDIYDVWMKMFYIWSDLRKYDSLMQVSEMAIELYPNQPLSYYFNGAANNQLENYSEAIKVLKRGLPLAVSNLQLRAEMFNELGTAYHETANHSASDDAFESSLKLVNDNAYTLNNYAYYLSLRNFNLERAAEMSLLSIQLVPNNASFEDTYGWILYQQKKYTEAKKWLEDALRNGGDKSGVVTEHYGDVLFKLGEKEKAVEVWEKAKKLGETSDLIDKKIIDKTLYE